MSEKPSGPSINIPVYTQEGQDNLSKLIEAFQKADRGINQATLSMIERIEQFDKKLLTWGNAAASGKLSQKVADEASRMIKALQEASRDLQSLGVSEQQAPTGRSYAQEIAERQKMLRVLGARSASLTGRGDIWTAENTPTILPHEFTPAEVARQQEQVRRNADRDNAYNRADWRIANIRLAHSGQYADWGVDTDLNAEGREQSQLIQQRLEKDAAERLQSEIQELQKRRTALGRSIAKNAITQREEEGHSFSAQLQQQMLEDEEISFGLRQERDNEHNRRWQQRYVQTGQYRRRQLEPDDDDPEYNARISNQDIDNPLSGSALSQHLQKRMQLEQEIWAELRAERDAIHNRRQLEARLWLRGGGVISEGIAEREEEGRRFSESLQQNMRARYDESGYIAQERANRDNRYNSGQMTDIRRRQEENNGRIRAQEMAIRLRQEHEERIESQRQQVVSLNSFRDIGSQDIYGLATRAQENRTLQNTFREQQNEGGQHSRDLSDLRHGLYDIYQQIDRINNNELNIRAGGSIIQMRQLLDVQEEFATQQQQLQINQRRAELTQQETHSHQKRALDRSLIAGHITPDQHARRLQELQDQQEQERADLLSDQYRERQVAADSDYDTIRTTSDPIALIRQRNRLPAGAEALEHIDQRIEEINRRELRIRIGGDPAARLQEIARELNRVTGDYARLELERERDQINRQVNVQNQVNRRRQQLAAGTITEEQYHRSVDRITNRAEREERRIQGEQREEDWNQGFIDPTSGRRIGNQRGVYGNNAVDRRLQYQVSNLAFGIDDALQSYQYDGIRGAVRGASNNLTAVLSTMMVNPFAMAATVIGASLGSILIPKLLAVEDESKKAEEALKRVNSELARMQTAAGIKFNFAESTSSSAKEAIQAIREQAKEARKIRETELTPLQKQMDALGDLSPATRPKTYMDALALNQEYMGMMGENSSRFFQGVDSITFEDYLRQKASETSTMDPKWRKTYEEQLEIEGLERPAGRSALEQWYLNQAEEIKRARLRGTHDELATKRADIHSRLNAIEDEKASQDASIRLAVFRSSEVRGRDTAYRSERAASRISSLTPEETQEEMEALFADASADFRQRTSQAREALVASGQDTSTYDAAISDEYDAFHQSWVDMIRRKVDAAKDDLERLSQSAESSDIIQSSIGDARKKAFDYEFGRSTDVNQIRQDATSVYLNRRQAFEAEQIQLSNQALAEGRDPKAVAKWMKERLRKFDLEWQKWIQDKVDAVDAMQMAENPLLAKDLRSWFGKAKNAQFLQDAGINLSDPNLHMHEDEQAYWNQVRRDQEAQKGLRASVRQSLDPTRNASETLKEKFEQIDDMQVDLYDKLIMKEGLTQQSVLELQGRNQVRSTNSLVESGSLRSLELQQLNFNANNPIVTALDRQLAELRQLRQAVERGRNLKPTTIFKAI